MCVAILIGERSRGNIQNTRKNSKDEDKNYIRCKSCGAILIKSDADLPLVFIHEGRLYAKAIPNYVVDVVNEGDIEFVGYTCSYCGYTMRLER